MLSSAAVLATWNISFLLTFVIGVFVIGWVWPQEQSAEIFTLFDELLLQAQAGTLTPEQLEWARDEGFDEWSQVLKTTLPFLVIPYIYTPLIVLIALGLYQSHPLRIRLLQRIKPVTQENGEELLRYVEQIAKSVSLAAPYRVYLRDVKQSNARTRGNGQVFGFPNRYSLILNGSLRRLSRFARTDNTRFRAVILHELGHVQNKDMVPTYLAQSIWLSFFVGVALPALITTLVFFILNVVSIFVYADFNIQSIFDLFRFQVFTVFKFAILVLGIRFIWGELIRVREYYADRQAADWGGTDTLESLTGQAKEDNRKAILKWLLSVHPLLSERTYMLRNTKNLFRMPLYHSVISGSLLALILGSGSLLVLTLLIGTLFLVASRIIFSDSTSGLVVGLSFLGLLAIIIVTIASVIAFGAYAVTVTLNSQQQKEAVLSHLDSEKLTWKTSVRQLPSAILIACGIEAGFQLTPLSYFSIRDSFLSLVLLPVWISLLAFATWLALVFSRFLSHKTLERQGILRVRARRDITFASLMITLLLYLPVFGFRNQISNLGSTSSADSSISFAFVDNLFFWGSSVFNSLCLVCSVAIWAIAMCVIYFVNLKQN